MPIWITLILWAVEFAIEHDDEIMAFIREILELLKIRRKQRLFLRHAPERVKADHAVVVARARDVLRRYAQAKTEDDRQRVKAEAKGMACDLQTVCGLSV